MTGRRLIRLRLTDFRNYPALTWRPGAGISVLSGANGSGKTNLLEAVSMLAPGRGMRGARIAELSRRGASERGTWAIAGRFAALDQRIDPITDAAADHAVDIGTGVPAGGAPDRRVFRVDGAAPRSQAEIAARVSAVWLTPQMDRLFAEGGAGRRRFLDRLVYALEPSHAREVAAHDSAMAQRNRLLAAGGADPAWLAGLEDSLARHAVAAAAARSQLAGRLNAALEAGAAHPFPAGRLSVICPIADRLALDPAVIVEDWLRAALAGARGRDAQAGSASLGAHRADMALTDARTGLPAALASTGQQRALLIGLVLGHAALIAAARGAAPILLLDEPAVHLDPDRRAALFAALIRLPAQILLTGTDLETFAPLAGHARAWRTGGNDLTPDPRLPGPTRADPPEEDAGHDEKFGTDAAKGV